MESKWISVHNHCHTVHSDASHTLLESARAYKSKGLDAMFLTDHNTNSGYEEIEGVEKKTNLMILKGIEYTTYFAHILSLGDYHIEWSDYSVDDLKAFVSKLKEGGSIVGLPHGSSLGYPFSTGYRLDYTIDESEYGIFDFMEIMNSNYDMQWEKDYKLWRKLIGKGIKINATVGLDGHHVDAMDKCGYVNMVKLNLPITKEKIREAIKKGDSVISKDYLVDIVANGNWGLGDTIASGHIDLNVKVIYTGNNPRQHILTNDSFIVNIIVDGVLVISKDYNSSDFDVISKSFTFTIDLGQIKGKYIGAELIRENIYRRELVCITNSIYLEGEDEI